MTMPTPLPQQPELITILAGIIERELDLQEKGRVFIYNQKYTIPSDPGLFIDIAFDRSRPFGSSLRYRNDDQGRLVEEQYQCAQETYTVNLFSKNEEALRRSHEVIFALHGTYAQQQAEKYSFKFGFIPTNFVDVSAAEAAARLNRYSLTFNVLRSYSRNRVVEYFDKIQNPPQTLLTNP